MLIVQRTPYKGRFHQEAVTLVKSGKRVGQAYVSAVEPWSCRICKASNPPHTFPAGETDAMVKCTCGVTFILVKV